MTPEQMKLLSSLTPVDKYSDNVVKNPRIEPGIPLNLNRTYDLPNSSKVNISHFAGPSNKPGVQNFYYFRCEIVSPDGTTASNLSHSLLVDQENNGQILAAKNCPMPDKNYFYFDMEVSENIREEKAKEDSAYIVQRDPSNLQITNQYEFVLKNDKVKEIKDKDGKEISSSSSEYKQLEQQFNSYKDAIKQEGKIHRKDFEECLKEHSSEAKKNNNVALQTTSLLPQRNQNNQNLQPAATTTTSTANLPQSNTPAATATLSSADLPPASKTPGLISSEQGQKLANLTPAVTFSDNAVAFKEPTKGQFLTMDQRYSVGNGSVQVFHYSTPPLGYGFRYMPYEGREASKETNEARIDAQDKISFAKNVSVGQGWHLYYNSTLDDSNIRVNTEQKGTAYIVQRDPSTLEITKKYELELTQGGTIKSMKLDGAEIPNGCSDFKRIEGQCKNYVETLQKDLVEQRKSLEEGLKENNKNRGKNTTMNEPEQVGVSPTSLFAGLPQASAAKRT